MATPAKDRIATPTNHGTDARLHAEVLGRVTAGVPGVFADWWPLVDFLTSDYLAGFVDGEGCLRLQLRSRRVGGTKRAIMILTVSQRIDRGWILNDLQTCFGGTFAIRWEGKCPCANWMVYKRKDIERLLHYFDNHPLILKADEYAIWKEAALTLYADQDVCPRERGGVGVWRTSAALESKMVAFDSELRRLKKFGAKANASEVPEREPRRQQMQIPGL